jgi:hypothetical protein
MILSRRMLNSVWESKQLCLTQILVSILRLKQQPWSILRLKICYVVLHPALESSVECLFEVMKIFLVLELFFTQYSKVNNVFCCATPCSKFHLFFCNDFFLHVAEDCLLGSQTLINLGY